MNRPPLPPPAPDVASPAHAASRVRAWPGVLAALLLPLLATVLVHMLSLRHGDPAARGVLHLTEVMRVDDAGLRPPPLVAGVPQRLPHFQPTGGSAATGARWLIARFELAEPARTTWMLALGHRTPVLIYLDGRLLANSVPLDEADVVPRQVQLGDRRLAASVPADWLGAGAHEIAVRVAGPGAGGASLSALTLGAVDAVEEAEAPRRFWLGLRVATMLSALVIGSLLLFAWVFERRQPLHLGSALYLLTLALLLMPYAIDEPPLPAPYWRMLLDGADVVARGLLVVVIVAWAAPHWWRVQRLAFGYIALGLLVDLPAAAMGLPWGDFSHPWPWWALGSRLAMALLALGVAVRALAERPRPRRLGTALLAGLGLWTWCDTSLHALVLPALGVVRGAPDLNVVAYAGWTLWVALLLHQRLVGQRRREQQLRAELAQQLLERSEQLHAQYAALQSSEQARVAAAERERLLQEMHDGLGAQLASAKMLASGGQITGPEMVDVLDACLREMRLAVDVLGVTDGDLGLLLATLRHRLEPALRAGGLVLDWRAIDTPRVPVLEGTGGREFSRIVQEAFANIVHHAEASRVEVWTGRVAGGTRVQIRIADDGRGMPAEPSRGRGLRGMAQRAARLGATIEWRAPPAPERGTVLVIELPLDRPEAPAPEPGGADRGASQS